MKNQIEALLDYAPAWKVIIREKLVKLTRQRIILRQQRRGLSLLLAPLPPGWRVLDYWRRKNGFAVKVERHGQVTRLIFIPADIGDQQEILLARLRFSSAVERLVALHGWKPLMLTHLSDPVRHFSGNFLRMLLAIGDERVAALAISPEEAPLAVDRIFGAGLLWLGWLQQRTAVVGLRLLVPAGAAAALASRLAWLRAPIELFEFDLQAGRLAAFKPAPLASDLYTWPERRQKPDRLLTRVLELAPALIRRHPRPGGHESLRIRGLEFARYYWQEKKLVYGVTTAKVLRPRDWPHLENLVREISTIRCSAGQPDHPYYYYYEERWLESLVLDDVAVLDGQLDRAFAYSQVPTYVGGEQAWIDVLACTRSGRLAVVELKCRSDLDLPLQGLHYWSRVWQHLGQGDFQKRGYFQGKNLRREPPLLYLVTPLFQIHCCTRLLLPFLSGEIEIAVVGINGDWKKGIQVLRRTWI